MKKEKFEAIDDYQEDARSCSRGPRQLFAGEGEGPIPIVLLQHVVEVGQVAGPSVGLRLGDGQAFAFRDQVDAIWFGSDFGFVKA